MSQETQTDEMPAPKRIALNVWEDVEPTELTVRILTGLGLLFIGAALGSAAIAEQIAADPAICNPSVQWAACVSAVGAVAKPFAQSIAVAGGVAILASIGLDWWWSE